MDDETNMTKKLSNKMLILGYDTVRAALQLNDVIIIKRCRKKLLNYIVMDVHVLHKFVSKAMYTSQSQTRLC